MTLEKVILFGSEIKELEVEKKPVYLLGGSIFSTLEELSGGPGDCTLPNESKAVETALLELGCNYERVDVSWPRDSYVSFNNRYLTLDLFEKSPLARILGGFSQFACGGAVVPGHDFLIASSYSFPREKREAAGKILRAFLGVKTHFVEPLQGFATLGKVTDHIDFTLGCVPDARIVTVDKLHYAFAREDFDEIASQTGYDVVPIDTGDEAKLLGNNYLVIEELDRTVINNKGATRVNDELRNLGINIVKTVIPLTSSTSAGGSVRCMTNRLLNLDLLKYICLYERCGVGPV